MILGYCTGLLPAAAAAVSADLLNLIQVGVEVIHIAFRVALYAHHRSGINGTKTESWAVVLSSITSDHLLEALDQFNSEKVRSKRNKST